jgi:hypothetical protein
MNEHDKWNLSIVAIVACVAIVGIVFFFVGFGGGRSVTLSSDSSPTFVGEAKAVLPSANQVDSRVLKPTLTEERRLLKDSRAKAKYDRLMDEVEQDVPDEATVETVGAIYLGGEKIMAACPSVRPYIESNPPNWQQAKVAISQCSALTPTQKQNALRFVSGIIDSKGKANNMAGAAIQSICGYDGAVNSAATVVGASWVGWAYSGACFLDRMIFK